MQNLNQSILLNLVVGLPPLAEQSRIVAKVRELMGLCDQLEAAQSERETKRDRLAAASLHHLRNEVNPDSARERAQFYLNHLPDITTGSKHIEQLRRAILNLAVTGRLVRQDPNDEPAEALIAAIQVEKAQLLNTGRLKKLDSKWQSSRNDLMLPHRWAAATLQSLCISITDGDHLPPPKADNGVPFLVIGNVRNKVIDFAGCRYVSRQYYDAIDWIRRPQQGDLLYTLVGSYGIPVMVLDSRSFCVQRHIAILRPSPVINLHFLAYAMASDAVFDQSTKCATGIAQKTVPLAGLRNFTVAIPPANEQRRIVTKVNELMFLCDKLEAQLDTTRNEGVRLLNTVLHAALNPATTAEAA